MIADSISVILNVGAVLVVAYAILRTIRFFFVVPKDLGTARFQKHLQELAHYIGKQDMDDAKKTISRIREEGLTIAHINSVFFGLGACLTSYFRLLIKADCDKVIYLRASQILARIADQVAGEDREVVIKRLLRLLGELYSVTLYESTAAPRETSPEVTVLLTRIGDVTLKKLKSNKSLIECLGELKQLMNELCQVKNLTNLRSKLLLPALTLRNVASYVERSSHRYPHTPYSLRRKLKYQVKELNRFLILFDAEKDEEVDALSMEAFLFPNREINMLLEKRREYERIPIPLGPAFPGFAVQSS